MRTISMRAWTVRSVLIVDSVRIFFSLSLLFLFACSDRGFESTSEGKDSRSGSLAQNGMSPPSTESEGQYHLPPASALGVGSGGGGDVYVCYNQSNQIVDMESADIWYGKTELGLNLARKELGQNHSGDEDQRPYMDQVADIFDKLSRLDPRIAELYKQESKKFSPEQIAERKDVVIVPSIISNGDHGALILPEPSATCHTITLERMVWQKDAPKFHEKKYQIVERLWNAAPETVKARIVRHETILQEERKIWPATNSRNTQYYNAVIESKEFLAYEPKDYLRLLAELKTDEGFNWKERGRNFSVRLATLVLESNYVGWMDGFFGRLAAPGTYSFKGEEVEFPAETIVSTFKDGTFKRGFPTNGLKIYWPRTVQNGPELQSEPWKRYEMSASGFTLSFHLPSGVHRIHYEDEGVKLDLPLASPPADNPSYDYDVAFDEDGKLNEAWLNFCSAENSALMNQFKTNNGTPLIPNQIYRISRYRYEGEPTYFAADYFHPCP